MRFILALAAYHDYEIEQMDVVTAFLNADVVSNIYMNQPQGFKEISKNGGELVCKLKKAIYEVREAPRAWNSLLNVWLVRVGFEQSKVDPVVSTIVHNLRLYILAVYVYDSILIGKQGPFIFNFKKSFSSRFQIEELGPASWLIGCRIERDRPRRVLRMKHDQYIMDILDEFKMSNATVAGTPMAAKQSTKPSTTDLLDKKLFPFAKPIGKRCTALIVHDQTLPWR
jgi:hypothetical protein